MAAASGSWWRRLVAWLLVRPAPRLITKPAAPRVYVKSRLPGPITKLFERELAMGVDDDTVRVSFDNSTFELDGDDKEILAEACRRTTLK